MHNAQRTPPTVAQSAQITIWFLCLQAKMRLNAAELEQLYIEFPQHAPVPGALNAAQHPPAAKQNMAAVAAAAVAAAAAGAADAGEAGSSDGSYGLGPKPVLPRLGDMTARARP